MEEGDKRREERADEICVSSKRVKEKEIAFMEEGHLKNEARIEEIDVAIKRTKARQLEILEEEKSAREVRDSLLHELRIKGEKARQEMEQRILAEDLRIKQFHRMKIEMEIDLIKSNKKLFIIFLNWPYPNIIWQ